MLAARLAPPAPPPPRVAAVALLRRCFAARASPWPVSWLRLPGVRALPDVRVPGLPGGLWLPVPVLPVFLGFAAFSGFLFFLRGRFDRPGDGLRGADAVIGDSQRARRLVVGFGEAGLDFRAAFGRVGEAPRQRPGRRDERVRLPAAQRRAGRAFGRGRRDVHEQLRGARRDRAGGNELRVVFARSGAGTGDLEADFAGAVEFGAVGDDAFRRIAPTADVEPGVVRAQRPEGAGAHEEDVVQTHRMFVDEVQVAPKVSDDEETDTLVIVDPSSPDGGTVFKPEAGKTYFEETLK